MKCSLGISNFLEEISIAAKMAAYLCNFVIRSNDQKAGHKFPILGRWESFLPLWLLKAALGTQTQLSVTPRGVGNGSLKAEIKQNLSSKSSSEGFKSSESRVPKFLH